MRITGLKSILSFISVVAAMGTAHPVDATRYGFADPKWATLQQAVRDSLDSKPFKGNDSVTISMGVGNDGRFYNAKVLKYAEDPQITASCLEAVCNVAPFALTNSSNPDLPSCQINFSKSEQVPRYSGDDVKKYAGDYPRPEAAIGDNTHFVAIHKIPIDVLRRFPGMFTEEEIISPKNLLTVGIGDFEPPAKPEYVNPPWVQRIKHNCMFWANQFYEHPHLAKQEIIELSGRLPRL